MNKLFALCGLVLLGTTTTPQERNNDLECNEQVVEVSTTSTAERAPVLYAVNSSGKSSSFKMISQTAWETPVEVNLDEIVYLEEETEIDLGFDTADYLPEGFDPHEQYVNLDAITFIENEEEFDLGFDTSAYLPEDFDPYAFPANVMNIDYIEEGEDETDLGFDTAEYLPDGFDPHDYYVDLDAIEYIEEDVWDIDFNADSDLPIIYDPYVN